MRSAAAAIAWEFRQRHRWALAAIAGYLLVLAAVRLFGIELHAVESFAFVVITPMTAIFIYFLAVFSFGLDADVAARHSIYPPRMFALPVTTNALAGWPMLYGSISAALLWFAARLVGIWPRGMSVPVVWPALLAASLVAWTQALTWMPYAFPGMRVIVTAIWLASIDAGVLLALQSRVSEGVMLSVLAPQIPLAFLVARFALARARRGDVPDWRTAAEGRERIARGKDFSSAARAQRWFEWRSHGWSLPAQVAILLPFELTMLFLFRDTPAIVFETIFCVLLTPPFMAFFAGASASKPSSPFLSVRPLRTVSLAGAKLRTAFASTLAAWLLVGLTLPAGLKLSGTLPMLILHARDTVGLLGFPRAVVAVLLVLGVLVAATWKQLVQSLWIGTAGREWLVKTSIVLAFVALAIVGPIFEWISRSEAAFALLVSAFPWVAAGLVCLKLAAAVRIAARLHDERLIGDRALIGGAVCWDLLVFALYGVLVWIFPQLLIRHYVLALVAMLEVPLVRISAAPLALARSRHQ